jgi:LCP family protein required for cell wall assembly
MDNFKKTNNKHAHKSVDGFIPNVPKLDDKSKNYSQSRHSNVDVNKLDSPRGIDGFIGQQKVDELPILASNFTKATEPGVFIEEKEKHKWFKRKKEKIKTPNPKKKLSNVKKSLIGVGIIVLVLAGYFGFNLWNTYKNVLKGGSSGALALQKNIDPVKLNGEGDGRVNILLLGKGGGDHPGADLTDTLMIASIDPIAKEAALFSLPRDLWVRAPELWSMKINAVYSSAKNKAYSKNENDDTAAEKAGVGAIENMVKDITGVPIHYYIMIDFEAFKQAVDAVGGVTINVEEPLYDYMQAWDNNNNPLIADAGVQSFDGKKALLYARSRYSSSDFARGERQRQIIVALQEKVMKLGTFSNPVTVTKLLDAVGSNVTTDLNLNEIMRIYDIGKDIPSSSIASFSLTDEGNVLVKTDNINGASVVVPRAGTFSYDAIQSYVRNSLRDSFLKSENASVVVLNGSGIDGLATKRAEELKSYGYNVTKVDTATRSDYATTELIDFTGGVKKYTKRYLEQRLKVITSSGTGGVDNTLYNADFVIIVGSNENTTTTQN